MWHHSYCTYCKVVVLYDHQFPISLEIHFLPTAAECQRDVMTDTQQCLLGKYYVQHVCVLSQGGVLSDGRKGNRMYSYPL